MAKRQLSETEKRFATKNLSIIIDELEYTEIELARKKLSIKAAPIEYKKQLKQMMREQETFNAQIEEYKSAIKTLKIQIKNGVEQKKNAGK